MKRWNIYVVKRKKRGLHFTLMLPSPPRFWYCLCLYYVYYRLHHTFFDCTVWLSVPMHFKIIAPSLIYLNTIHSLLLNSYLLCVCHSPMLYFFLCAASDFFSCYLFYLDCIFLKLLLIVLKILHKS